MGDIADEKTVSAEKKPAHDAALNKQDEAQKAEDEGEELRFPPEEEAKMLKEFDLRKAEAKEYYDRQMFQWAMHTYDKAYEVCPKYLYFPRAVIKSNISMCHLAEEEFEDAIKAATDALAGLDRVERDDPRFIQDKAERRKQRKEADGWVDPVKPSPPTSVRAADPEFDKLRADVLRIRTKTLLRRGRSYASLTSSRDLEAALKDFKTLMKMNSLPPADKLSVKMDMISLPKRIRAAQEAEVAEMLGKMKNLGDGILKPFGLSTDSFEWSKDEKTGGYSVNIKQNAGPSGRGSKGKRPGGGSGEKPSAT